MRRTWVVVLAALLCACAGTTAGPQAAAPAWDDAAAQEARLEVEGAMNAFAAMDLEGFTSRLSEDAVAYEFDLENKPMRLGSRDEVAQWFGGILAELKEMGATVTLDVHSTDCHATAGLAYCTVEFDLNVALADGGALSQPTRNTIVLREGDDGWKWMHWHSSPAELPEAP